MKNLDKNKKGWKTKAFKDAIRVLLFKKPIDKGICKVVEELNELSNKLMQYINKPFGSVPYGSIEEEIADVEMNLVLLKKYFPVSEEIRKEKIKKFLDSKDFNFYLEEFKRDKNNQNIQVNRINEKVK